MSCSDIARASGLSRRFVIEFSKRDTWPVEIIEKFSGACGVNLMDTSSHIKFLRNRKKIYMANADPAQRRMFARIMADLQRLNRSE